MLTGDEALVRGLARDYRTVELRAADRAMLDYAAKLTRAPHTVSGTDVQRLRDEGFDDAAVLDICQVTSYYNYVNRMADGLGVELEDVWQEEDLVLSRAEFDELRRSRAPVDGLP